jgi:predicted metal-dependent hydrolase
MPMWTGWGHRRLFARADGGDHYRQSVLPASSSPVVVLRPSAKRKRTVTAYREGDQVVVLVPARMSRVEQERWAERMVARITEKEGRGIRGDEQLLARAQLLVLSHLPEVDLARWSHLSVRWSSRQKQRWASCTPLDGAIRVSDRLRGVPEWVLDTVLLHELAHLVEANHSPRFHALVDRHPRTADGRLWLEGFAAGLGAAPMASEDKA